MIIKYPKNVIVAFIVIAALLGATVLLGGYANSKPANIEAPAKAGCYPATGKMAACPTMVAQTASCPKMAAQTESTGCPKTPCTKCCPKPCCAGENAEGCCDNPCPIPCPKPCCAEDAPKGCCGTAEASGCCPAEAEVQ